MVTREQVLENKAIKSGLTRVQSGNYIGSSRDGPGLPKTLKLFGCQKCNWIGTKLCPHGIMIGNHHSNWICSDRIQYMKEEMEKVGSVPRLLQNEMAIKLKLITESMEFDWLEGGELHDDYKHLMKVMSGVIDKARRQDEGIKIAGELTVAHEDFRKMVEVEAKKIEEQNKRTRPAEFTEEISDS